MVLPAMIGVYHVVNLYGIDCVFPVQRVITDMQLYPSPGFKNHKRSLHLRLLHNAMENSIESLDP
jgi:hypothetical protein